MVNHAESNDPERAKRIEGPMKNKWYVYICKANTGRYYVGISTNPEQRLDRHNNDGGAKFAHDQGPFKLVYTSASLPNKAEARRRELQIKGWARSKKEKLISGEWV